MYNNYCSSCVLRVTYSDMGASCYVCRMYSDLSKAIKACENASSCSYFLTIEDLRKIVVQRAQVANICDGQLAEQA